MKKLIFAGLVIVTLLAMVFSVISANAQTTTPPTTPPAGETVPPPIIPPVKPGDIVGAFFVLAGVARQLVSYFKTAWQSQPNQQVFDVIAAVAACLLVTLPFKLNLFEAAGFTVTQPWATWILSIVTALLMAATAGVYNSGIGFLSNQYQASKAFRVKV